MDDFATGYLAGQDGGNNNGGFFGNEGLWAVIILAIIFGWRKCDAFHSELAHRANPNIASIHEFSVHEFFFYLHVFTFYQSNRSAMLTSKANRKFFFFSASQAFE